MATVVHQSSRARLGCRNRNLNETAIMEFNRILVYLTVHALFGQLDEYDSRLIEDTWLMGDISDDQRETLCDLFNKMIYATR